MPFEVVVYLSDQERTVLSRHQTTQEASTGLKDVLAKYPEATIEEDDPGEPGSQSDRIF